MKVFCCYLKDALKEKACTYIPISEYESFDILMDFISNDWEKKEIFFEDYKMIYPRLMS